jgi:hypothetical protein
MAGVEAAPAWRGPLAVATIRWAVNGLGNTLLEAGEYVLVLIESADDEQVAGADEQPDPVRSARSLVLHTDVDPEESTGFAGTRAVRVVAQEPALQRALPHRFDHAGVAGRADVSVADIPGLVSQRERRLWPWSPGVGAASVG